MREPFRILWNASSFFRAHQDKSLAILRHSVMRGVQNLPLCSHIISDILERQNYLVEEPSMFTNGETLDVFEDKGAGIQLSDDTHELENKAISRVLKRAMADQ